MLVEVLDVSQVVFTVVAVFVVVCVLRLVIVVPVVVLVTCVVRLVCGVVADVVPVRLAVVRDVVVGTVCFDVVCVV